MRGYARKVTAIAASLALASFTFAACGDDDDEGNGGGGTTNGGAAAEGKLDKPVKFVGFEGPAAQGGPDFMNGMRLAVEQLNAEGGIGGQQVELEIEKTGGTPQGAASAYRTAAQDPDVMGTFIGAAGALAIKSLSNQAKLPAIAASGNNTVQEPVAKYMFSNSFGPEYVTSALSYGTEKLDAKSFAVIHYETDFSSQVEEAVNNKCEEIDCEITAVESAASTDSVDQLTAQLTKMKSSNPDAYYLEGLNANVFKAARQLNLFDKPVLSENWLATPALVAAAGSAVEGVVAGLHKCRLSDFGQLEAEDPLKKYCEDYVAAFEEQFPKLPFQLYSVYGHDAVMTYAAAINTLLENGEDVTRDNVVKEMESFDGSVSTSHGKLVSAPDNHRLTGEWSEAYVDQTFEVKGENVTYKLAPDADAAGSTP